MNKLLFITLALIMLSCPAKSDWFSDWYGDFYYGDAECVTYIIGIGMGMPETITFGYITIGGTDYKLITYCKIFYVPLERRNLLGQTKPDNFLVASLFVKGETLLAGDNPALPNLNIYSIDEAFTINDIEDNINIPQTTLIANECPS